MKNAEEAAGFSQNCYHMFNYPDYRRFCSFWTWRTLWRYSCCNMAPHSCCNMAPLVLQHGATRASTWSRSCCKMAPLMLQHGATHAVRHGAIHAVKHDATHAATRSNICWYSCPWCHSCCYKWRHSCCSTSHGATHTALLPHMAPLRLWHHTWRHSYASHGVTHAALLSHWRFPCYHTWRYSYASQGVTHAALL